MGTVVLSDMRNLQYVPALVMSPDCGPVCLGQCSVCDTRTVEHVLRTVVQSGMGSVHYVPTLVMYPVFSMYQR